MPPSSTVTFGDLLKHLRKRAGMTQADLAAAVGYSVPFISNLELNQRLPNVQFVGQRFVPALGLQEDPRLADRLVELAAAARGERPPAAVAGRWERPPGSHEGRAAHPIPLPAPPTELIGRTQEIKTICNRLLGHNGRLMTLVGPPGIGKTRLGLAVAQALHRLYQDGAFFAPLASISDAELVAPTLLLQLGVTDSDVRRPELRLIEFLRRKETLLVLDNFEQIIAAAPFVAELLAACPGLRVLVTSRERLHLRAEQRYQVPPLELAFALALFVQRAQALNADFVLTTENQPILSEICQRLDCLPLAVELIAARLDLFAPQTLLARLRDRRLNLLADGALDLPARQRTLRNAIHRSYDLLNAEEARLFRRLGVFVGGFDQEALTHCGGDERTLQSLINKSLVQVAARNDEARRFLLLETIREYAWEQLRAHNELAVVQHLHAGCFVRLAEDAASHLRGADQARWLERLAGEDANLRAALAWALNSRQTQIGARLGIALWRFWYIRGYYDEGWAWLEELLAQTEEPQSRAHLLYGQGMLARRRGDYTTAADRFTGSLTLFRELGDPRGLASALRGLAFIRYRQDDYDGARPLLDEALHLFRMLDDSEGIAVTLDNLAYIAGDSEEERRLYQESLVLRRRSGNLHGITTSLAGLAYTVMDQGDSATARVYLQEHLQINQTLGNKNGIAASLLILGGLTLSEGDYTGAELLLEESLKLVHETGDRSLLPGVMEKMGATALARGEYKRAYERFEQALTLHRAAGTPYGIGLDLSYFACLAAAQGEAQRALTLLGAVAAACEPLRIRYRPPEQGRFAQAESTARQQLGEEAAAAAWAAGQGMTLEQAIAYARELTPDSPVQALRDG